MQLFLDLEISFAFLFFVLIDINDQLFLRQFIIIKFNMVLL